MSLPKAVSCNKVYDNVYIMIEIERVYLMAQ